MTCTRQNFRDNCENIPRMPAWVTSARAETLEDVAFLSGAALSHLHFVLRHEEVPQSLLRDRLALRAAAVSGNPKFFLGTDSAPHAKSAKENACGCAGMFSAMTAIELYAEVFEKAGALDKLEAFASKNGARFYGIPENADTITLVKQSQTVPASVPYGDGELVPMRAGGEIGWTVKY